LARIDRRAIAGKISAISNEKGAPTANRVRAALSGFFAWCIREGLIDHNVVIGTNIQVERSRERVLSDTELRRIWNALGSDDDYSRIVKVLMLTGQRANEIGALRWPEIVGDKIQLPPARTKNNRGHIIPITAAVRAILDDCQRIGDAVFGRSQGFRGWAWGKERLDQRIKTAGGELEHWTHHDLRRSMATRMAELGIAPPHIIEAILNHSGHKTGVHGIYNRATYEPQKRIALQKWADHVEMLVSGKRPSIVVTLRGA
jgi:integrase